MNAYIERHIWHIIWAGSEQELLEFVSDFKKKHPSIKFESEYSQTKIELSPRCSIRQRS